MLRKRCQVSDDHKTHNEIKNKKDNKTRTLKSDVNDVKLGWKSKTFYGFQSWQQLVKLLCQPSDPACLGAVRIIFGLFMISDTLLERGMSIADALWGEIDVCRFPLFNFLHPLPLQWMYIVYLIMVAGALGIMLGFKFRFSCLIYLVCYWYLFLLTKESWNNHSYLFGLLAFLFFISDANRYWSLDGYFNPSIRNAHIPSWNYFIMRAQIFLVYFIAGLKKLDYDWVFGYSMQTLEVHWVFLPFRLFLSDENINMIVVHIGGLIIDLSVGFLLFFEKTKPIGLTIATSFHLMNSQMFSIGMFPYVMLATNLLFCSTSWPRQLVKVIPRCLRVFSTEEQELQESPHCFYEMKSIETDIPISKDAGKDTKSQCSAKPSIYHQAFSSFTILFIALQCFLPYSHGITKGYNNWTNGLYGYSWDMMVHRWNTQHLRITYHDKDTGKYGYLNPMVWISGTHRWASHADMIKQFAVCIAKNLKNYKLNNVEIYFDIWLSLNGRFQQRMVNPNVDILTAEWSPFEEPSFSMPLIVDLSNWREKLVEIETALMEDENISTNVVFIADFPGLYLDNYVQPDYGNTSLFVLDGNVVVELADDKNITLGANESVQIPANTFHKVYTVSERPSCYMYLYVNTSENTTLASETPGNDTEEIMQEDEEIHYTVKARVLKMFALIQRSFRLGFGALWCIVSQNSFDDFLNATYTLENPIETSQNL